MPKLQVPPVSQQSKLYEQCVILYELLFKGSVKQSVGESGVEVRIWSGRITRLVEECDQLPLGGYGNVLKQLYHLGCITQLQEGRVNVLSEFAIHKHPSRVPWTIPERKVLTRTPPSAILAGQVDAILRSLGGLNVVEALMNIEGQLEDARNRIAVLEKERTVGS